MKEKLPFSSIGDFYRSHFGTRVRKIPVTVADDCPNRRGLKGMQTCIFCDEWGSAAYDDQKGHSLRDQISERINKWGERHGADAYLVYFQAYTNTFLGVKKLREHFDTALSFPQVKGLVIGTRPDCLSSAVLDLWTEYNKKCFMSVELGVQTFDDEQLLFLRRGHDARSSITAIKQIKAITKVNMTVHLMFGLPGETDKQLIETARLLSSLPVDGVKLHNLHVLKNTPLETLFRQNEFVPITLEEYTRRVGVFLDHLSPRIAVHRLAALASRWEELVSPDWTRHHMKNYDYIRRYLISEKIFQGRLCNDNGADFTFAMKTN